MPSVSPPSITSASRPQVPQGSSNQEDQDIWYDAIDLVEMEETWFDTCEEHHADPSSSAGENADVLIPLTEDCRRGVQQLVRALGGYGESMMLSACLSRILPGTPTSFVVAANSLYTAITERRNIDAATVHALGLASRYLPDDMNVFSRLAAFIRDTVSGWTDDTFLQQFLGNEENNSSTHLFIALAITTIVAGRWMKDEGSPQRGPLKVPTFIANLFIRAHHYWTALGNMASSQPSGTEMLQITGSPRRVPAFEVDTQVEMIRDVCDALIPCSSSAPRLTAFSSNSTATPGSYTRAMVQNKPVSAQGNNDSLSSPDMAHFLAVEQLGEVSGLSVLPYCTTLKAETRQQTNKKVVTATYFNTKCDAIAYPEPLMETSEQIPRSSSLSGTQNGVIQHHTPMTKKAEPTATQPISARTRRTDNLNKTIHPAPLTEQLPVHSGQTNGSDSWLKFIWNKVPSPFDPLKFSCADARSVKVSVQDSNKEILQFIDASPFFGRRGIEQHLRALMKSKAHELDDLNEQRENHSPESKRWIDTLLINDDEQVDNLNEKIKEAEAYLFYFNNIVQKIYNSSSREEIMEVFSSRREFKIDGADFAWWADDISLICESRDLQSHRMYALIDALNLAKRKLIRTLKETSSGHDVNLVHVKTEILNYLISLTNTLLSDSHDEYMVDYIGNEMRLLFVNLHDKKTDELRQYDIFRKVLSNSLSLLQKEAQKDAKFSMDMKAVIIIANEGKWLGKAGKRLSKIELELKEETPATSTISYTKHSMKLNFVSNLHRLVNILIALNRNGYDLNPHISIRIPNNVDVNDLDKLIKTIQQLKNEVKKTRNKYRKILTKKIDVIESTLTFPIERRNLNKKEKILVIVDGRLGLIWYMNIDVPTEEQGKMKWPFYIEDKIKENREVFLVNDANNHTISQSDMKVGHSMKWQIIREDKASSSYFYDNKERVMVRTPVCLSLLMLPSHGESLHIWVETKHREKILEKIVIHYNEYQTVEDVAMQINSSLKHVSVNEYFHDSTTEEQVNTYCLYMYNDERVKYARIPDEVFDLELQEQQRFLLLDRMIENPKYNNKIHYEHYSALDHSEVKEYLSLSLHQLIERRKLSQTMLSKFHISFKKWKRSTQSFDESTQVNFLRIVKFQENRIPSNISTEETSIEKSKIEALRYFMHISPLVAQMAQREGISLNTTNLSQLFDVANKIYQIMAPHQQEEFVFFSSLFWKLSTDQNFRFSTLHPVDMRLGVIEEYYNYFIIILNKKYKSTFKGFENSKEMNSDREYFEQFINYMDHHLDEEASILRENLLLSAGLNYFDSNRPVISCIQIPVATTLSSHNPRPNSAILTDGILLFETYGGNYYIFSTIGLTPFLTKVSDLFSKAELSSVVEGKGIRGFFKKLNDLLRIEIPEEFTNMSYSTRLNTELDSLPLRDKLNIMIRAYLKRIVGLIREGKYELSLAKKICYIFFPMCKHIDRWSNDPDYSPELNELAFDTLSTVSMSVSILQAGHHGAVQSLKGMSNAFLRSNHRAVLHLLGQIAMGALPGFTNAARQMCLQAVYNFFPEIAIARAFNSFYRYSRVKVKNTGQSYSGRVKYDFNAPSENIDRALQSPSEYRYFNFLGAQRTFKIVKRARVGGMNVETAMVKIGNYEIHTAYPEGASPNNNGAERLLITAHGIQFYDEGLITRIPDGLKVKFYSPAGTLLTDPILNKFMSNPENYPSFVSVSSKYAVGYKFNRNTKVVPDLWRALGVERSNDNAGIQTLNQLYTNYEHDTLDVIHDSLLKNMASRTSKKMDVLSISNSENAAGDLHDIINIIKDDAGIQKYNTIHALACRDMRALNSMRVGDLPADIRLRLFEIAKELNPSSRFKTFLRLNLNKEKFDRAIRVHDETAMGRNRLGLSEYQKIMSYSIPVSSRREREVTRNNLDYLDFNIIGGAYVYKYDAGRNESEVELVGFYVGNDANHTLYIPFGRFMGHVFNA